MKRYILLVILGMFTLNVAYSCGGWESNYFDFYTLFIDKDRDADCNCGSKGNLEEWDTFFAGKYENIVRDIVLDYSVGQMEVLIALENNPLYLEAFEYLVYAKELGLSSQRIAGTVDPYSWDYEEIMRQDNFDEKLLNQGISSFETATNRQLKMRYAYQVIRYLHYNGKWQDAIDFFNTYVPQMGMKNEIYYYCLDQVSGCYYSTEDYVTAAFGFIEVVENSRDRKLSASRSFSIDLEKDFPELLDRCRTSSQKILARTLASPHYYDFADAEWILENEYDEEALMSIYFYNDVHEESGYYSMSADDFVGVTTDSLPIQKDEKLIKRIIEHRKTVHHDFWYSCLAYLAFSRNDFVQARNYYNVIDRVKDIDVDRYAFYLRMYNVFGNDTLMNDSEDELFEIYQNEVLTDKNPKVMEDVFFTMLRSYYFIDGSILKANLITYLKDDVNQIYSFEELDQLQALYQKEEKSNLEKFFMDKTFGKDTDINDYITEKKGSLYLMQNNNIEAKGMFAKLPVDYKTNITSNYYEDSRSYQFDGFTNIPKKIFSINIKEGFNFPMDQIMTDEVCYDRQFDFIKDEFTKAELNNYLIELNVLAGSDNVEANYLLANYYYNTSGLGYFRNILLYYPENNLCLSCRSHEILQDYWYKSNTYYARAKQLTSSKELKARITYLMAKNLAFVGEESAAYKSLEGNMVNDCYDLFDQLKTDYKKTKFYKEIIKECTVFSYYVAR